MGGLFDEDSSSSSSSDDENQQTQENNQYQLDFIPKSNFWSQSNLSLF